MLDEVNREADLIMKECNLFLEEEPITDFSDSKINYSKQSTGYNIFQEIGIIINSYLFHSTRSKSSSFDLRGIPYLSCIIERNVKADLNFLMNRRIMVLSSWIEMVQISLFTRMIFKKLD